MPDHRLTDPVSPRWHRTWIALAIFAGSFALYMLTTAHDMNELNSDVWSANYASWRVATTGSPWIENVSIPRLDHDPNRSVWVLEAANGHTVIGRAPGVVAAALPAYWVMHPSSMTTFPGAITASVLTAGSLVLLFLALAQSQPLNRSVLGALAFGFATPVWSISANGLWPQTVTGFGIAGMAWASATRRWWLVGLFGGIALWARLHAAVIIAVLGLLVSRSRRDARIAVRVGVVSGGMLVLMCVWTHWMYGTWNPTGSYDNATLASKAHESVLSPTNQLGMWVSPDRGILVWTPCVLLLLPALFRSWRDLPDWSRALIWGGLGYTLLQAALNPFYGGYEFYGYRYGLEFLACAAPALVMSVPRLGTWGRALLGPLLFVQALAFAIGATFDQVWISLADVWRRNAFVTAVHVLGWPGAGLVLLCAAAGWATGRAIERSSRATTHSA